jgi:hypothetical protein
MSRKLEDINLETIQFSKQKINSQNRFLYVYSDKKFMILKLPKIFLPFGLQKDNLSKKNQYLLDLSMKDNKALLESFQNLDDYIIKKVHSEFFSEKDLDSVKKNYTSCLKYPENVMYAPTLRTKIILDENNNPKCDFYESEKVDGKYPKINIKEMGGEQYLLNVMGKNSAVESIIECMGLWFFGEKFGLSFKVSQLMIYPKIEKVEEPKKECQFIDSDSDTSNSEAEFLGED